MIHRAEDRQYYTIVDGAAINDAELSMEALGLLVRMLSMSDEWEFSIEGLAFRFGVSKNTLSRCFKELKARGYLEIKRPKTKAGQFTKSEWHIYEVRHVPTFHDMENHDVEFQNVENHDVESHVLENGTLTNINITNINKTNIKVTNIKEAHGEFENVMLTAEEFTKLEERLGTEDRDGLIEELSCYLRNHPKKYKDHYATILSWARKRTQGNSGRKKAEPITLNPFDELLKKEGFT